MCGLIISFLILYCPDKYLTEEMCDEAVDDSLTALKLIPGWFFTNEMIIKLLYCFVCR